MVLVSLQNTYKGAYMELELQWLAFFTTEGLTRRSNSGPCDPKLYVIWQINNNLRAYENEKTSVSNLNKNKRLKRFLKIDILEL